MFTMQGWLSDGSRDVYFTLLPPGGGDGMRMAKNLFVAQERNSVAVGRGVIKAFRCGKKMYNLGQRLRSFKTLRCGTNMKL